MLTAAGLAKSYRSRQVVRDFGLSLRPGEVVGLLGPNGAGKTTCFYMIVGLVPADAGQIVLDGKDITALPMHERARRGLGYLPQEASVFRKLSVADNIAAVLELRTDLTPETVSYFVRNGVAWMAPFRKTEISDAELAAIGAYLSAPLEERGLSAEALAKARAAQGGAGQ